MKFDDKNQSGINALRPAFRQFGKFLAVGLLNTAFSYMIYAAGLALGLHFSLANLLAMLLGILFSFRSQGRLVFSNRNPRLFWRFAGTWCFIWLCNISIIALLRATTGLDAYTCGAITILPVTLISFVTQKYFVFTRADDDGQKKMPPTR